MKFKTTIKQLAEDLEVEYSAVQGLMKFLEIKGSAVSVGIDKIPGMKGKGSTIWEIPESIHFTLKVKDNDKK